MIDHEKIEQAVRLLLEGMGEDVNREGLIDTPDRIARMYEEIYGGMDGMQENIFLRHLPLTVMRW